MARLVSAVGTCQPHLQHKSLATEPGLTAPSLSCSGAQPRDRCTFCQRRRGPAQGPAVCPGAGCRGRLHAGVAQLAISACMPCLRFSSLVLPYPAAALIGQTRIRILVEQLLACQQILGRTTVRIKVGCTQYTAQSVLSRCQAIRMHAPMSRWHSGSGAEVSATTIAPPRRCMQLLSAHDVGGSRGSTESPPRRHIQCTSSDLASCHTLKSSLGPQERSALRSKPHRTLRRPYTMRRSLLQIPTRLRCCQDSAASACLAACGSRAPSLLAPMAAGSSPIFSASAGAQHCLSSRSWASTAVAAAAADEAPAAAAAPLAPCERGPQAQAANEVDRQLAAAAQAGGPAAVLQIVEEQGESFTELNVVNALAALGSSSGGEGGMSGAELVRSRPFQTLVGESRAD